jgi:hypothetical protein
MNLIIVKINHNVAQDGSKEARYVRRIGYELRLLLSYVIEVLDITDRFGLL